jgi:hypothetical protein
MVGIDEQKIDWQVKRVADLMAQTLKENKIVDAVTPPMYTRDILGITDAKSATVERVY